MENKYLQGNKNNAKFFNHKQILKSTLYNL